MEDSGVKARKKVTAEKQMGKGKLKKLLVGKFTIGRLIRSVVFVYVCIALFVWFFSDRLIFLLPKTSYQDSSEIIKVEVEKGIKISAIYLQNKDAEFTILYSHGNAEDTGDLQLIFEMLNDSGFSVFAYDYRGYGTSGGKATEKNCYTDIEAIYEYMVEELKIPADKIIAHGRSVGGAVAMHLACTKRLAGLILESAFVSAFRVITKVPLIPFDKFINISKIKKVYCPVLVMHGGEDRIVPAWHGKKLFEVANEPKYSFWVDEAGHNDLIDVAGIRYFEVVVDFAKTINDQSVIVSDKNEKK